MKKFMLAAVPLLWSSAAFSQPATYSTDIGRLQIPALVIDGKTAFDDVELSLSEDGQGDFKLVDFSRKDKALNGVQALTLGFDEAVQFNATTTLKFIDVLSESRCPSDVVCITAGEVTVLLEMMETLDGGQTKRTIFGVTLQGLSISEPELYGTYFRLAEATPYPVSTVETNEEDYVITVEYSAVPFK